MMFLSLLPAIGAGLIWAPTAILLLLQGHYISGAVLLAVGIFIISLIDNILRPRLIRGSTQMPDYLILLATLGGISTFGLSGFIVGPVMAALFITCWEMAGKMFGGAAK